VEAVQSFLKSCRSGETRKNYEIMLQKYIDFVGEDNLFCDHNPRLIEQKIIEFILFLRDQGKSHYAIRNYVQAIKSFYRINDVVLNGYKITKYMPEMMKVSRDRAYTHEEIGKMLAIADERMKVVILLLASTGIRIGSIPNIKYKHLSDNRLTVYEGFSEQYATFATQETLSVIQDYLDFRQRYGEKIAPESFLIREQFDLRNPGKPQQVVSAALQWNLRKLAIKCGIRKNGHKYTRQEVMIAHGFRKFFTTQLVKSKVNPEIREMLLGHKIGLASCYYRPTEEEMYTEYEKAIDSLTIDPSQRLQKKIEDMQSDEDALMERIMQKMEAKMQNK
jgi:integrase